MTNPFFFFFCVFSVFFRSFIFFSNIEITTTFTSSSSEKSFFLLSLLCELHAPILLRLMSATLDEAFFSDSLALPRISSYLTQISTVVDELTQIMLDAVKGSFGINKSSTILPECFYWEIRPWFNGGKWIYEGVNPEGGDKEMEWGGPSAGQSSLVHALDVFLSVDHTPRPSPTASTSNSIFSTPTSTISLSSTISNDSNPTITLTPPTTPTSSNLDTIIEPLVRSTILMKPKSTDSPLTSDATFMVRASQYMPSHHRSFLQHLSQLHIVSKNNPAPIPSVRELALRSTTNSNSYTDAVAVQEMTESYDEAVKSMKRFRDGHMRLVTVFIITVSKREPRKESIFWSEWDRKRIEAKEERRRKVEQEEAGEDGAGLVGTGGTELVGFLKLCRERTVEALVG